MLISIDSLRADHVGAYGYFRNTTPNIDRVAANSIVFEQAISQLPQTRPSHMTMLTSLYPDVHRVYGANILDSEMVTLAEQLKTQGYRTVAFTDGAEMAPEIGFDQGFDEFTVTGKWFGEFTFAGKLSDRTPIIKWLEENHKQKFFLFFHTYDAHLPYLSPEMYSKMFDPDYDGRVAESVDEFTEQCAAAENAAQCFMLNNNISDQRDIHHAIALYDGCIRYVDHYLGLILSKIEELNFTDKTLIVITSDHGEQFMEHGNFAHGVLYDHDLHVPLIMHLPSGTSKMVKTQVRLIDLAPTLLEVLDVEPLKDAQGISLLPLVSGSEEYNLPAFSSGAGGHSGGHSISIRYMNYKYIEYNEAERGGELYKLDKDPRETENLYDIEVGMRNKLSEMLERWQRMNAEYSAALENLPGKANLSRTTLEQLKSLGYVQ